MEPLSILGAAANILQLMHFGLEILSKSKELRKKGATEDYVSIEAVAKHLRETLDRIRSYSLPSTSAAQKLRTLCLSVVDELLKALDDLKVKGESTRWKSFRNALKTIRSKEQIESWTRQLNELRDEYNLELEVEILVTIELAKIEQMASFKSLEQSQQDLTLTLTNALLDNHDQFEAIAERHAVSIQKLVQQEHERSRALTLYEASTTRQLIKNHQGTALEHISRESDETRMVVISTSIKATHATESSLEEVTQHLDGRLISESKELQEKLAEAKAALEKEVRESSATAVGKVLDFLEVEHFVAEVKNEHDGQRIVNVWSPPIPQIQYHIQAPKPKDITSQVQWTMASRKSSLHSEPERNMSHSSVRTNQAKLNRHDKEHQPKDRHSAFGLLEKKWTLSEQTATSIRRGLSSDVCVASGTQSRHRPFDQPFGLRIRCIEAIPRANDTGRPFLSGRWKPPTQPDSFRVMGNVQHLDGDDYVSQDTCFFWWPPHLGSARNQQNQPSLTRIAKDKIRFFKRHKAASLFWAADHGTILHVPFDCTQQQVEDLVCEEPEPNDKKDLDDARVTNQNSTLKSLPPQQPQSTWRRLQFDDHWYDGDGVISIARYTGGSNELAGTMPERWLATLIPAVHKPQSKRRSNKTSGLTGDLPLLLGLVVFNDARNDHAISAINRWFPPSKGFTDWKGPTTEQVTEMERSDRRVRRGMVIETFHDSRRPEARLRLEEWEDGRHGPIIT